MADKATQSQDTQDVTPATPVEETPKVDYFAELAKRATDHLDKDKVTRAQAVAYVGLLTGGPTGSPMADFLGGIDQSAAIEFSSKVKPTPTELRDSLRREYAALKPSHQWLKAVIATAVEIQRDIDNGVEIPS